MPDATEILTESLTSAGIAMRMVLTGVASGTAMTRITEIAREVLPNGIATEWTDLAFQQEKQGIPTLVIFAVSGLFVFLVLAAQYESWKTPLAILLIVPMCLLASAFGLDARSLPIDILAQIGFVVLLGLAAKNAILIVEFAKHRQDNEGDTAEEAAVYSARTRLRPILMTALVAGFGFIPMATSTTPGAEIQRPLATVVIGGLVTSTLLTTLVLPAIYPWFAQRLSREPDF
ncbi:efflux RND transporter permease subunit [Singulisphaera rosea]